MIMDSASRTIWILSPEQRMAIKQTMSEPQTSEAKAWFRSPRRVQKPPGRKRSPGGNAPSTRLRKPIPKARSATPKGWGISCSAGSAAGNGKRPAGAGKSWERALPASGDDQEPERRQNHDPVGHPGGTQNPSGVGLRDSPGLQRDGEMGGLPGMGAPGKPSPVKGTAAPGFNPQEMMKESYERLSGRTGTNGGGNAKAIRPIGRTDFPGRREERMRIEDLVLEEGRESLEWRFVLRSFHRCSDSFGQSLRVTLEGCVFPEERLREEAFSDLPAGKKPLAVRIPLADLRRHFSAAVEEINAGRKTRWPRWRLEITPMEPDGAGARNALATAVAEFPMPESWFWKWNSRGNGLDGRPVSKGSRSCLCCRCGCRRPRGFRGPRHANWEIPNKTTPPLPSMTAGGGEAARFKICEESWYPWGLLMRGISLRYLPPAVRQTSIAT